VELARLGYNVTGIDLSAGMLQEARRAAEAAGVEERVRFIQADATRFCLAQSFDIALCLCEGAFTLVGAGEDPLEHDAKILRNTFDALRPGGRFLLTALNAMRLIRSATAADVATGR